MTYLERSAVFFLYAFALGAPVSISVGSIAAGGLILTGLTRLAVDPGARRAVPRPVAVALALWLAWTVFTTFAATPYATKLDTLGDETWIKLLMPALAAAACSVPAHVVRALLVYLGIGAGIAIYGIYQHFTGDLLFEDGWVAGAGDRWHAVGAYGHHLSYGGHVVGVWLLAVAYATSDALPRAWWRRGLLAAAGVLISLALLWSHARSAQLGGIAGALVIAAFLPVPRRRLAYGLLALVVLGALLTPTVRDRFARAADLDAEQSRPNLWRTSLHGIAAQPWTGYGVGNFRDVLREHEVQGLYESRAHAHNDVLMVAVTTGIPGALLFVGFLGVVGVEAARATRRAGPHAWIVAAALATHAALVVGGLFQVYQTDDEVELTLYFLLGCAFAVAAHPRNARTN